MNPLSLHPVNTKQHASPFAEPYDNNRVNNRHIKNYTFDAFHTGGEENPPPPTRSITESGVRPKNIWSDFYQRDKGNCLTVSAMKAAMVKFGHHPAGIYKEVTRTPTGYDVIMRDDEKVSLTHEELQLAREKSGFEGRGTVLKHAVFLYAASAKRAQNENNDGVAKESFSKACDTLNDGEFVGEALQRLGLKAYIRHGTVEDLKKGALGTLANFHHSVAVADGFIDLWRLKIHLENTQWDTNESLALLI